jgi:hypothetical protein
MKYKEAIEKLLKKAKEPYNGELKMFHVERLYQEEFFNRIKLRSHGVNQVTESLAFSVLYEMDEWIVKVCKGIGWESDACEKAKMECRSTAIASMKLTEHKQNSVAPITNETEAHKKLMAYMLLGQIFEDNFKIK